MEKDEIAALRKLAEKCRWLACVIDDDSSRTKLFGLADGYEAEASALERALEDEGK